MSIIYDPLDPHREKPWRPTDKGSESEVRYRGTYNWLYENRDQAEKRLTDEFKHSLKRQLDKTYGEDEGHKTK